MISIIRSFTRKKGRGKNHAVKCEKGLCFPCECAAVVRQRDGGKRSEMCRNRTCPNFPFRHSTCHPVAHATHNMHITPTPLHSSSTHHTLHTTSLPTTFTPRQTDPSKYEKRSDRGVFTPSRICAHQLITVTNPPKFLFTKLPPNPDGWQTDEISNFGRCETRTSMHL